MAEQEFKSKLNKKFSEFELKGLKSYLKYLQKEEKNSEGKKSKKAYHKYIVKEIGRAEKKIAKRSS